MIHSPYVITHFFLAFFRQRFLKMVVFLKFVASNPQPEIQAAKYFNTLSFSIQKTTFF